jgi:hypothetical protein
MEQNSDGQMETKNKVKKETPTNVELALNLASKSQRDSKNIVSVLNFQFCV